MDSNPLDPSQQVLLGTLIQAWQAVGLDRRAPFRATSALPTWAQLPFFHPGLTAPVQITYFDYDTLIQCGFIQQTKAYGSGVPHEMFEIHFRVTNAGLEHEITTRSARRLVFRVKQKSRRWWHRIDVVIRHPVISAILAVIIISTAVWGYNEVNNVGEKPDPTPSNVATLDGDPKSTIPIESTVTLTNTTSAVQCNVDYLNMNPKEHDSPMHFEVGGSGYQLWLYSATENGQKVWILVPPMESFEVNGWAEAWEGNPKKPCQGFNWEFFARNTSFYESDQTFINTRGEVAADLSTEEMEASEPFLDGMGQNLAD